MRNIAITGATGFVGSGLVKFLSQLPNINLYLIARKSSDLNQFKNLPNINIAFYDGTFDSLNIFFGQNKIDLTIHLATLYIFDHNPQNIDNLIDTNIKFGCHLLEAMSSNNCHHLINAGTYIQNYFSDDYYPSCLYAATKQAMMDIIDYYVAKKNISAITLKLYDAYGPLDKRKKILNLLIEAKQTGQHLNMTAGEQEMRLTHINDICSAFMIAADLIKNSDYHNTHSVYYVGGKAYKLKEIVNLFEKITKQNVNINWGAVPYREKQPIKSYIGKILPNWQAELNLEDGIKNVILATNQK